MSELNYQLLTKEEQEIPQSTIYQRYGKLNPVKRAIDRFTLPKPTDAIGRKKELLEKIEILICLLCGIGIIIWIFVSNHESYPQRTRTYNFHYEDNPNEFPLPVFGLCFPNSTFQGWTPVVWRMTLRKNFAVNQTATCAQWSPAGRRRFFTSTSWPIFQGFFTPEQTFSCESKEEDYLTDSCADVVTIDYDQQCVAFGNENCSMWRALREYQVVEVQLLAFWSTINQFPTTTPGGWYDNSTIFFHNTSAHRTQVLLGGVTQAILEFKREDYSEPDPDDWRRWGFTNSVQYPTSITTLNVLENHFHCRNGTLVENNQMCYNITLPGEQSTYAPPTAFSVLELQIRLQSRGISTTTVERGWDFIFRSLKDIGGFLGVVLTVVTFLISKLLTRILFSKQDAFFDTQMRLAVTYFLKERNRTDKEYP